MSFLFNIAPTFLSVFLSPIKNIPQALIFISDIFHFCLHALRACLLLEGFIFFNNSVYGLP